jgi:hypothetical protein
MAELDPKLLSYYGEAMSWLSLAVSMCSIKSRGEDMDDINNSARAVADLSKGEILASVEIAETPERVFRALVSVSRA